MNSKREQDDDSSELPDSACYRQEILAQIQKESQRLHEYKKSYQDFIRSPYWNPFDEQLDPLLYAKSLCRQRTKSLYRKLADFDAASEKR